MEEIVQLRLANPRAEWLQSLSAFVNVYDASSSSKDCSDNRAIVKAIEIIVEKLADRSTSGEDDTQLEMLLLDAVRILLRFRAELDQPLTVQLMNQLVQLACRADQDLPLKQLAVRCLINLLFDNEENVRLFTSLEVDGLKRLGAELCSSARPKLEMLNYRFYIVRLAYMMVSQSASILSDSLSPTESATKQLVRSLIICMHHCSAAASTADTGSPTFPHSEAAAKLYLETSKLLYALSVHEVLQNCASEPVTDSDTSADTDGNGNSNVRQLKRLLGESILCALTGAGAGAEQNEVRSSGTAAAAVSLRECAEQCEEKALQLAMYAPADMLAVSLPTEMGAGESKADRDDSAMQSVVLRLARSVLRILERLLKKAEQIKRSVEQAALLTPALVVLTNLVTFSPGSREVVKNLIFPSPYIPSGNGGNTGASLHSLAGGIQQIDLDHPAGMHNCANPVFDTTHTNTAPGKTYSGTGNGYGHGHSNGSAGVSGAAGDASNGNYAAATGSASDKKYTTPSTKTSPGLSSKAITTGAEAKNTSNTSNTSTGGGAGAKMDPIDAPADSTRGRLMRHMTSLDSQLKRCAAELIFLLCDEDPDEFTSRTGFGNAVALLQIKGLC